MGKIELTKDEALLMIRLVYFYLDCACCMEKRDNKEIGASMELKNKLKEQVNKVLQEENNEAN
nr:MAG TPA: hypothetical protein [Caudoviricetes sp.]